MVVPYLLLYRRYICKHYFADQSKPRSTDACVALAACLPHYSASKNRVTQHVLGTLPCIICESPASGIALLCYSIGLSLLGAALEMHINFELLVSEGSLAITNLCDYSLNQLNVIDYARVVHDLEHIILPVLLQGFKLHLSCTKDGVVGNIMVGLIRIVAITKMEYPELTELICEAMRLHPDDDSVQYEGGKNLS